jgi:putative oxidoreductase
MNKILDSLMDHRLVGSLTSAALRIIELMQAWLTPLFDLALRFYVAKVFFSSGLQKLSDWESTVALFQYEYQVPVLSPALAAAMGTAGELTLPLLLAAGLLTRVGAAGLFVVNLVAVISYPDISDAGIQDHVLWGTMLLVSLLHGPGRWSLDYWLKQRWQGNNS